MLQYFVAGLMMAGGSVGQMLIPLIIQGLFQGFGMRGGMLIYSAVVLQSFVACALFQPSRWHWKRANPAPAQELEELEKNGGTDTPPHPNALPQHVVDDVAAEQGGRGRANSWTPEIASGKPLLDKRVQRRNSHQGVNLAINPVTLSRLVLNFFLHFSATAVK